MICNSTVFECCQKLNQTNGDRGSRFNFPKTYFYVSLVKIKQKNLGKRGNYCFER